MARRRKSRSRWTFDGGGIAMCALAVVFAGMALNDAGEYLTLAGLLDRGVEAEVRITGSDVRLGRHKTDIIAYEFTPADSEETVTGEDRFALMGARNDVPVNEYLKLHSHKLRVRYLPSDPTVSRLTIGLEHRKSRRGLWFFGLMATAVVLTVVGIRRCRL